MKSSASKGSGQEWGEPLRITLSLPAAEINTSKITLFAGKDSSAQPMQFELDI